MSAATGNHDAPPEALAVAGPLREPEPARRGPRGGGAHARGRQLAGHPVDAHRRRRPVGVAGRLRAARRRLARAARVHACGARPQPAAQGRASLVVAKARAVIRSIGSRHARRPGRAPGGRRGGRGACRVPRRGRDRAPLRRLRRLRPLRAARRPGPLGRRLRPHGLTGRGGLPDRRARPGGRPGRTRCAISTRTTPTRYSRWRAAPAASPTPPRRTAAAPTGTGSTSGSPRPAATGPPASASRSRAASPAACGRRRSRWRAGRAPGNPPERLAPAFIRSRAQCSGGLRRCRLPGRSYRRSRWRRT